MADEKAQKRASEIPSGINENNYQINRDYFLQMLDVANMHVRGAEELASLENNAALTELRKALEAVMHSLYQRRYLEIEQYKQNNDCEVTQDLSVQCYWVTHLGGATKHWVFSREFYDACRTVRENGNLGAHVSIYDSAATSGFNKRAYQDSLNSMLFILGFIQGPKLNKYFISSVQPTPNSTASVTNQGKQASGNSKGANTVTWWMIVPLIALFVVLLAFVAMCSSPSSTRHSSSLSSSSSSSSASSSTTYEQQKAQEEQEKIAKQAVYVQEAATYLEGSWQDEKEGSGGTRFWHNSIMVISGNSYDFTLGHTFDDSLDHDSMLGGVVTKGLFPGDRSGTFSIDQSTMKKTVWDNGLVHLEGYMLLDGTTELQFHLRIFTDGTKRVEFIHPKDEESAFGSIMMKPL